ncbi:MAG: hypothetical protein A2W31_11755 [Planctomycetes bacterium RBG_16_64_10]|nr:MAG: hypothetical protein A2W31_11755 [Planctomycetes bacterium RBG_16_64_10]
MYWTKAASILKMPQTAMLDSEVPVSPQRAAQDMVTLLRDNVGSCRLPSDPKQLVFDGWRQLCERYAPVFLEKSPHHLVQWSALQLIQECMQTLQEIDFLLVGLIRNPMATLYSAFRRWRIPPEQYQYEWLIAYQNLQKLVGCLGDRLVVVRYEDMVVSPAPLRRVFDFCGAPPALAYDGFLHQKSIAKWRKNAWYGFQPAEEVVQLAEAYGYQRTELVNQAHWLWPIYRDMTRGAYRSVRSAARTLSGIRNHRLGSDRVAADSPACSQPV